MCESRRNMAKQHSMNEVTEIGDRFTYTCLISRGKVNLTPFPRISARESEPDTVSDFAAERLHPGYVASYFSVIVYDTVPRTAAERVVPLMLYSLYSSEYGSA